MIDPQVQEKQNMMMNRLRSSHNVTGKIIILDDDKELSSMGTVVNGRISKRLMPIFEEVGMKDDVLHFVRFEDLREAIDRGYIDKTGNLFVLDSTLSEGDKEYSFEQTVPWLVSSGIRTKYLMPGSGGPESLHNNQVFVNKIENMGYNMRLGQENLSAFGLSGSSKNLSTRYLSVAEGILSYAESLNIGSFSGPLKEIKNEIQTLEGTNPILEGRVPTR
jgi:hypothetical protein